MTTTRKMRPLQEIYSQAEIDRATAYVTRVYENGPNDLDENPLVSWGDFVGGFDELESYVEPAIRAVLARRWYAVNGPQDPDLQPLPLGWRERLDVPKCGAKHILFWFARSLAHLDYDITRHPSFYDYACGTLALESQGQRLEKLKHRFPPRLLPGLDPKTADWSPPTTAPQAEQQMADAVDQ
jgi:hypothetical protein